MTLLERPDTLGGRSILKTDRLVLRPLCPGDAPALVTSLNDLRVSGKLARVPHPYSLADAQAFVEHIASDSSELAFVITLPDGILIGSCGINRLQESSPEIGYWLGVPWWGAGYATEAARAVIDYAFTTLGCEGLVSGALVSNPASRRVLEKCGFQWTGVALPRIRALGTSSPCDRFRLDRKLWSSLRDWGRTGSP